MSTTKRPSFARVETDFSLQNMDQSSSKAHYVGDDKHADTTVVQGDMRRYDSESSGEVGVVHDAKDLVTNVLHVEDDPTVNPWTFRFWFIGIGLSVFGSVLQEIFYFKPQTVYVSVIFLTVLAYIMGEGMAFIIPRKGRIGKILNPGPFNAKEHAAIAIMASAASVSALATEALAVQELYYGGYPNKAGGIFITMASQLIGYGIAGLLRETLVYPTKMLWPINLPISTLLETLHRDKAETKQRLKIFYILFFTMFVWETIPEYIFPLLTGFSIFCLAKRDSLVFTNLFGGANGNEGLGFLNVCFDWNYIAGLGSPLWIPLQTLVNSCIGYLGCIFLFMGLYYTNTFRAQDFPFLSQILFDGSSNSTNFVEYNTTTIFTPEFTIDEAGFKAQGIPYLTGSYIGYLITTNMGLTATFVHMLLYNYDDLKSGWSFVSPSNLKKLIRKDTWVFWKGKTSQERREAIANDPATDPHYRLMLQYEDAPDWWYGSVLAVAFIVGLVCLYILKSTLPWWGFIVANLFTCVFVLFFGAQYAITGFGFNLQPVCQMLAGYLFPGRPLANMWFTTFTYNSTSQAQLLVKDLKLAQYVHLSPKCTFTAQVVGAVIGALFNFIMMLTIVKNQAPILVSIEGTNIWSGQNVQQFNTLAIAWSVAKDMFSVGARYQYVTIGYLLGFLAPLPLYAAHRFFPKVGFNYFITPMILWYMGWLFVGINSSITSYFIIGFFAQFYLRKYKPQFFVKYNYIVSAALDGGTQVIIFILTFAVFGGSGKAVEFPAWAGNNYQSGNYDYCMVSS